MDRMLVVVFDDEVKAYEEKNALIELDNEASIAADAHALIAKNADGTATVKYEDDMGPVGTLVGTTLGSLIGLLGGPVALVIGAAAGMVGGGEVDVNGALVGVAVLMAGISRTMIASKIRSRAGRINRALQAPEQKAA